ncbi:hypothetical protein T484DRAFT_1922049 [Baffinella frigidus]|nr:hypothetical protein T484DRAFT_1922049 [Cryptophyta sp. CCMP2293]
MSGRPGAKQGARPPRTTAGARVQVEFADGEWYYGTLTQRLAIPPAIDGEEREGRQWRISFDDGEVHDLELFHPDYGVRFEGLSRVVEVWVDGDGWLSGRLLDLLHEGDVVHWGVLFDDGDWMEDVDLDDEHFRYANAPVSSMLPAKRASTPDLPIPPAKRARVVDLVEDTESDDSDSEGKLAPPGGKDGPSGGKDGPSGGKDGPSGGKDGPSGGKDGPSGGKGGSSGGKGGSSGKSPFSSGKSSSGKSPFSSGKSPFFSGKSPFSSGKSAFSPGKTRDSSSGTAHDSSGRKVTPRHLCPLVLSS